MPIENEHKYVVERIPNSIVGDPIKITQFYFAHDNIRKLTQRCRVTIKGNNPPKYEITHKLGKGATLREVEYEISESIFNEMKEYFPISMPISKTRYHVMIDGLKWDVDLYDNGMITAELENPPSEYSVEPFGIAVNVTGVFQYTNYSIAMYGYPIDH